jgi:hypothetical protein
MRLAIPTERAQRLAKLARAEGMTAKTLAWDAIDVMLETYDERARAGRRARASRNSKSCGTAKRDAMARR